MQAIQTKILHATNTKPTRIKAWCARGSITLSAPLAYAVSDERAHAAIAQMLVSRFAVEDFKEYGTPHAKNPWSKARKVGCLPDGSFAHVFID
jgi:hypothetical protein